MELLLPRVNVSGGAVLMGNLLRRACYGHSDRSRSRPALRVASSARIFDSVPPEAMPTVGRGSGSALGKAE